MKKENRFVSAGKNLFKRTVDSAYSALKGGIVNSSFSSTSYNKNDLIFWDNNGNEHRFQFNGQNSAILAYGKCPPIPAIINRMAKAYVNGKTWVLNSKGKEATSDQAKALRNLMSRPNPYQSWKEFEAQAYIYKKLFGYTIILPIKPFGFPNIEATSLWNIPPFMVDIQETQQLYYQKDAQIIKQIVLTYKGSKTILQADDVYIMKDFSPSFDSVVIPESPIKALELPINNIIGAYESRNVLINYRGALGIISAEKDSSGPLPISNDEKQQLQKDFSQYGLKKGQWQVIISKAAMKWQPMGYATKDLMLFEEVEADIQQICDTFNYPYELLSNTTGVTFANKNEAKKLLYQDALIPEANSDYEQWNQFFNTDEYNLRIEKDFSHVAVLQEDDVKKSLARKNRNEAMLIEFMNNVIPLNRWLEINDEDPRTDEFGKMYYYELLAAGWTFGTARTSGSSSDQNNNGNNNDQNANQNQ